MSLTVVVNDSERILSQSFGKRRWAQGVKFGKPQLSNRSAAADRTAIAPCHWPRVNLLRHAAT